MRRSAWKTLVQRAAVVAAAAGAALLGIEWWINAKTTAYRHTEMKNVPTAPVGIVFGAGLEPSGAPSGMLADRLDAAIELYRAGTISQMLFSGDNSRADYDEVGAMQQYVVARGVPSDDIVLDHAGFDTYDTCYRARAIFGVQTAVLITQQFHLPRAVYICRALGVDASGLGTADWGVYGDNMMLSYSLREMLADARAVFDVHITHRKPRFLGPFIGTR